jgi:hypothetical protein
MEKRMEKRKNHRMAALDLDPSSIKVNHSNISSVVPAVMKLKLPVLDPSVFLLDSFNDADWIWVHRRKLR